MDKDKETPKHDADGHESTPLPEAGLGFKLPESNTAHGTSKPSVVAAKPLHNEALHSTEPDTKAKKTHGGLGGWIKHHRVATALMIILLIALITAGVVYATRKPRELPKAGAETTSTPTPTPAPTKKASPLTGVEVEPAIADQPVFASIIENLVGTGNARPQSGLTSAGVVYEALSEGGITRYLAVWQADVPTDIGPVRSLRPIFYDSAMEYSAPVAHAGGSTDGLALANSGQGFKDMDQFFNGSSFRRITTRYAPHNLFSTGADLLKLVAAKGWNTVPTFTPWTRKDDAASEAPNATAITIDFSAPDYRAGFTYDKATNSYPRTIAGKPDLDQAAGLKQVTPKTVIVVYAGVAAGTQPNGKPKTDIDITGTGKGIIFQDGIATPMTWTKSGSTARMKFTNSEGKEIALNRGQSWVSYVPANMPVTYK